MLRILCRQSRSTLSSISFARSACSYCCNPRPWIQAPMSTRSSRCGHIYVSLPYPRLFPRANRETAEMGRRRSSSAIPCRNCVKLLPEPAEFWISNRDVAVLWSGYVSPSCAVNPEAQQPEAGTNSSTRRFCGGPVLCRFEATAFVSPKPHAEIRPGLTPCQKISYVLSTFPATGPDLR